MHGPWRAVGRAGRLLLCAALVMSVTAARTRRFHPRRRPGVAPVPKTLLSRSPLLRI